MHCRPDKCFALVERDILFRTQVEAEIIAIFGDLYPPGFGSLCSVWSCRQASCDCKGPEKPVETNKHLHPLTTTGAISNSIRKGEKNPAHVKPHRDKLSRRIGIIYNYWDKFRE